MEDRLTIKKLIEFLQKIEQGKKITGLYPDNLEN